MSTFEVENERNEFEEAAASVYPNMPKTWDAQRGCYVDFSTQMLWRGWRLARQSEPAATRFMLEPQ